MAHSGYDAHHLDLPTGMFLRLCQPHDITLTPTRVPETRGDRT